MQVQFQRQASLNPEIGMVCFDNVRQDSAGGRAKFIRSSFIESFVTTPEIILATPSGGEAIRLKNYFVLTINTNDGCLSTDLMNRALPIHLTPKGNVQDRVSPIGNPRLEFLPRSQAQIQAELLGMIERWRKAGRPLDETVLHPMSPWAKTVGGILMVNGFTDFLGNYAARKTVDDPVREALAILAAVQPGQKLRPGEWASVAVDQGLAKILFSPTERDTDKGRERAIGVVLKNYLDETFEAKTETTSLRVRLEGGFRRWTKGKNPHTRYAFTVLEQKEMRVEGSD